MQDGKALQAGTSHFLGQNFAKAFDVRFTNKQGTMEHVWATSWGVSTRLMGALVMAHSDDDGLVLPPKLAPIQVVIVPIYKSEEQLKQLDEYANNIKSSLMKKGISVKYDNRDTQKPGWKFSEYEMKGVPVRLAIGPRDMENQTVELARRDTKEKTTYQAVDIDLKIEHLLEQIQDNLYKKALDLRSESTHHANSMEEFNDILNNKGGFVFAHWDGTAETEQAIKEETKATIRCIPLNNKLEEGKCILTSKPSKQKVMFARAY
ncbi:MAG TPA: His/Gly/Thr/Pro-type tRNA ligase C-terminal domain-containing protein, partial [Bacteroidia bacterium]|nr:His/Gly/Thr/Pro-type tRNA ligase C-terminal domain-containing protein [Bacteroidia bacterium]